MLDYETELKRWEGELNFSTLSDCQWSYKGN